MAQCYWADDVTGPATAVSSYVRYSGITTEFNVPVTVEVGICHHGGDVLCIYVMNWVGVHMKTGRRQVSGFEAGPCQL